MPAEISDVWQTMVEQDALLARQVFIDGDVIVLDVAYRYEIPLAGCNDASRILAWVVQISDKTWATPLVIQRFVRLAAGQHGIDIQL